MSEFSESYHLRSERVEDAIAYLELNIRPRGVLQATEPRQIFRGWMFASSPGVFRIVRGLVMDIKTRDYVAEA